MTAARLFLASVVVAVLCVTPAGAHGNEITTFEYASQGCAGGGDVCGSFPLVPGDATYAHHAAADGSVSVDAAAEGVAPACAASLCRPNQLRFHAEAVAGAWADISTPEGLSRLVLTADYAVEQLGSTSMPVLGHAHATSSVVVAIWPAPGVTPTCSDGSAVAGARTFAPDTPGTRSLTATISCVGGGTLDATTWRVSITARASATADGGEAHAEADAQLHSVDVHTVP